MKFSGICPERKETISLTIDKKDIAYVLEGRDLVVVVSRFVHEYGNAQWVFTKESFKATK